MGLETELIMEPESTEEKGEIDKLQFNTPLSVIARCNTQ